ncbi:hypothetical protein DFP72DRAFT_1134320 [Ephemerocybe angulata]|uniref:Uncharacterized protein n=1 Tax=Ephemerocybe angulata TaxID=980116 RepID=A0A8H6HUA9_9AGAR|nr:hypothetical protein DFP72DRAFT_1134320 [Tulosesus angulatus]
MYRMTRSPTRTTHSHSSTGKRKRRSQSPPPPRKLLRSSGSSSSHSSKQRRPGSTARGEAPPPSPTRFNYILPLDPPHELGVVDSGNGDAKDRVMESLVGLLDRRDEEVRALSRRLEEAERNAAAKAREAEAGALQEIAGRLGEVTRRMVKLKKVSVAQKSPRRREARDADALSMSHAVFARMPLGVQNIRPEADRQGILDVAGAAAAASLGYTDTARIDALETRNAALSERLSECHAQLLVSRRELARLNTDSNAVDRFFNETVDEAMSEADDVAGPYRRFSSMSILYSRTRREFL